MLSIFGFKLSKSGTNWSQVGGILSAPYVLFAQKTTYAAAYSDYRFFPAAAFEAVPEEQRPQSWEKAYFLEDIRKEPYFVLSREYVLNSRLSPGRRFPSYHSAAISRIRHFALRLHCSLRVVRPQKLFPSG